MILLIMTGLPRLKFSLQGGCQIFYLLGMAIISAVPTGNSKNLGIPPGNRIPPGNQAKPRRKSKIYLL